MNELVCLSYSPWSEKARWALDHHRVAYRRVPYQPLLGEPALRLRMRALRGTVSVPVLFADGRCIRDSLAIAQHAESVGDGAPLFPPEHLGAIERWNARAEAGLAAGRALGLVKVLQDKVALRDLVPRKLGRLLGPTALPIAAFGIRRTLRKYAADAHSEAEHTDTLRSVLEEIRAGLVASEDGPDTLLGRFSYADITAAQVLQFVSPNNLGSLRLAPSSQRAYRREGLEEDFADLVKWRDALYARHRP